MHEILAQISGYARGMWRYRWLAVALAWAVAISGWIYVARMPDEYTASARVFVDTSSVLRPLLQGLTVQPDLVQRVSLMSRMLLSRPNLEKIMSMSDLDLDIRTEQQKEQLLSSLGNRISIAGDRSNPSLYSVRFQHRNPESAKKVVQSLVSVFIEEALTGNQQASTTARDFLDQEIDEYESRLKESEHQLADFKRKYAGLMSGDQGGFYSNLEAAKAGLKDSELALQEAIQQREELSVQITSQDQAFISGIDDLPAEQLEDPRIAALEGKLEDLLLRYTEKHPDVLELRRLIDASRARNKQQTLTNRSESAIGSVQADTFYGSLQLALSEADTQIAAMRARVEDYTRRVKQLEEQIDSIPRIEAELKQLTRNYTTVAGQHQSLLQRRETARLSTQVEKTTEGVKFRVIDPPFVPQKPSAPNRIALSGVVLLLATGVGLAAALAMDLLRPVFDDRRQLYRVTGLPVLGTVALVQSHADRRRERMMLIPFFAVSTGLILAFILVVTGIPVLRGLI
ncbi:XrtA system polysaccharide chain length determinant [Thiocystis violascens]|uniref:Polysaccharide chain length determinant protein, PEP-CTERM locus subfamily n=1 Tax=Thiocystis violascens (strain ATCC 17096 / DSM 198 / 6111) TaxID=765911 RepID=I3YGF2_THIV6|nr:XrtA system polysaccharide chain length determinant [Thiocystis violascens]AFL76070.1 polysaccharide chain length determinant protein, PEP-CTERM locus subfamily [Thiocystis violascens DSM 198]